MRVAWIVATIILVSGCLAGSAPVSEPTSTGIGTNEWPPLLPALYRPISDGPLKSTTEDYDLGKVKVGGRTAAHSNYEYEARIRGTITMPDGPGPFPLAVFLHGQHSPCSGADDREGSDCTRPYRNDRGYVYLMEHLASHGIATASILAFEINRLNGAGDIGMWARGELVLATIDALVASAYSTRLNFSSIGLMGHSRGGEGVVTATEINANRTVSHALRGVIALAPTDFAYRHVRGIPFLTLAPYCDGDVYSLHGLRQFDQSRYVDDDVVKVQLLVMGANHNNYNTKWGRGWTSIVTSDGDDADFGSHQNPECDLSRENYGGRMTLQDTYAEAKLHMGGFLRWTMLGEASLANYFLGAPQPVETCPGGRPCPGAVHVSTMTPGRRDLFWAQPSGVVGAPGVQVGQHPVCSRSGCAANVYSSAWMADLNYVGSAGFSLTLDPPLDARATPMLNLRVAVTTDKNVNTLGPPRLAATFADAKGATTTVAVNHPALFIPPSLPVDPGVCAFGCVGGGKVSANAVVIPLPSGVDAGSLTRIQFTFTSTGPDRVLLADAWLNRETTATHEPQVRPVG